MSKLFGKTALIWRISRYSPGHCARACMCSGIVFVSSPATLSTSNMVSAYALTMDAVETVTGIPVEAA
jgi:hypothetical protein